MSALLRPLWMFLIWYRTRAKDIGYGPLDGICRMDAIDNRNICNTEKLFQKTMDYRSAMSNTANTR